MDYIIEIFESLQQSIKGIKTTFYTERWQILKTVN